MLLTLKSILTEAELASAQQVLNNSQFWIEGSRTAGTQAMTQKNNWQLQQHSPDSQALQSIILSALARDVVFQSAALPRRILPPLFNRYGGDHNAYGPHVDSALLKHPQTSVWQRSDLSCTIFLSDPEAYDGGELTLHDVQQRHRIKLAAGDAVIYSSTSVHEVTPVTRGIRLASFFWIESLVRSAEQRRLLFDLDINLTSLRAQLGETAQTTALAGVYHNLLRFWATP
jgi:PKHD-type hydroxylase